jgi:integrase
MRHSLSAASFERGANPPEVAEIARHANAKVTLTMYAGLTKDGRGRAAAKLLESGFGK